VNKELKLLQRTISWLDAKGIADLPLDVRHHYDTHVRVSVSADRITREQAHKLKTLFQPDEVTEGYRAKGIKAQRKIDDDFIIIFEMSKAMTCDEMDEDEIQNMSDSDWDRYREKAKRGEVIMQKCDPAKYLDAEDIARPMSHN